MNKREIFLEKLERCCRKWLRYNRYGGLGFLKKIKRLIISPDLYITHLLLKYGLKCGAIKIEIQKLTVILFWGKVIKINQPIPSWPFKKFAKSNLACLIEENLVKFFIKNLNQNDIFYDVGANYGFYTYLALEFCKEVHSFEPIDYLVESIKLNCQKEIHESRLFINKVALSNKNGETDFYLYENNIGCSSMVVNSNSNDKKIVKVKTTTLDDYLKNHKPPTVIKVDVEGAEKLVIEGGINFLKNNSPIISIEVWSKKRSGEISMEAVNLLRNLGYQSFYVDFDGNLHEIDGDLSEFVAKNKKGFDNFVFKKQ